MRPTERSAVTLRPLADNDAETIAGWAADPVFRAHAGWRDLGPERVLSFHRDLIGCPPGDLIRLGAVVDARLVGYVDLHGDEPGRRELGFVVGERPLWGRGLGTALGAAGLDHAFRALRLDQVWAEALEANESSIRILRRLGLDETGPGVEADFLGRPSRYRQFVIRRSEWRQEPGDTRPDS